MKATEILSAEHRVIEKVLDGLEAMAARFQTKGRIEKEPAIQAIEFIRNFADRYHHGKEEVHFFPRMEARGFPRDGGPTGVMMHEHEMGRDFVRGMAEAVEAGQVESFVRSAEAYVDLLRQHIEKEDHCLFSMADTAFDAKDQQELADLFEKSARAELAGLHETYLAVAQKIEEWRAAHSGKGVRRAQSNSCSASTGCPHS